VDDEAVDELDFDLFVRVLDTVRKALMEVRRKKAGYSDKDIERYQTAFEVYDEDGSGDIEKKELTNLLQDLGIPMRSKAEQQNMLLKLDLAKVAAKEAGVDDELLGDMGDPSVTFDVLLFLVRMLAQAADHAAVELDRQIFEQTKFTPKEAEEFREIFNFWSAKATSLDAGQEAPEEVQGNLMSTSDDPEASGNSLLTQDGVKRVVRSLNLSMMPSDKHDLDQRLDMGPHDFDNPGKFGFLEFLLLWRWMLDTNFCNIQETLALAALDSPRDE